MFLEWTDGEKKSRVNGREVKSGDLIVFEEPS